MMCAASMLTGCGFHLRGQGTELTGAQVWLVTNTPNADFERSLKQRLSYQGATLVASPEQAEVQLAIESYDLEKRTVARDSLGRAAELELIFTLNYQMLSRKNLTPEAPISQKINSRREFAYDRGSEVGQDNEQRRLIGDMHQDVISRLLLQLAETRKQTSSPKP